MLRLAGILNRKRRLNDHPVAFDAVATDDGELHRLSVARLAGKESEVRLHPR